MIVTYGDYIHTAHENWWRFQSQARHSSIGLSQSVVNRITLWGVKKADSQALLLTALEELETAYSVDGGEFRIYFPDGTTLSRDFLPNAGSINGVQVKSFTYLDLDPRYQQSGAEYVNKRTYQIVLEVELIDNQAYGLLAREETLIGIGTGGSPFILKPALTGPFQKQQLSEFSSYRAIQIGRAVGYLDYPLPAGPIFPADEHVELRQIVPGTPKFGAVQNSEYPISWRYEFESASQLTGGPTSFR